MISSQENLCAERRCVAVADARVEMTASINVVMAFLS